MDFHGLTRKQLQALCKANKIPANMTNLAMADALSALDNVEGIDEVMQPQSPGKEYSESPEVPKTITRTSTRVRKPPVKVMESGGVVSNSTARISRKLVDDVEKNDLAKTPAVAGTSKRVPAAASRKKPEVPTVQKVYSTRRSVRLVEKQLSELCLGESISKTRTQPIKIDIELSSEITESVVKGDNIAEASNEKSVKDFTDDEVYSRITAAPVVETIDTACVVQIVCEQVSELEVKEEVPMKSNSDHQKDINIDNELDSVAMVEEEASFEMPADQIEVEENINEVMKMETQANNKLGRTIEDSIDNVNGHEQVSCKDLVEVLDSCEPKLVTLEKKLDAQSPALEQNTDLVKDSPPEAEQIDKENIVECFKAPKKELEQMSMRELRKLLKVMNISNTANKDKEGDAANKHQDTPRPTRRALETLPQNAHPTET